MLYEIEPAVRAGNSVILLHQRDNVAIARARLEAGQQIESGGASVVTCGPIPAGHKVALHPIAPGEAVYRYGNVIGFATDAIEPGAHVHLHNLGFQELGPVSTEPSGEPAPLLPFSEPASFLGYARADGRT